MRSVDEYIQLLERNLVQPLTPRERLIWSVGTFATDLEMGGLSGFLYNVSPDAGEVQGDWTRLRELVAGLELIGAMSTARVLADLLPRLEASATDDGTWGGFLEARSLELDDLEPELETYDELFGRLDAYLARTS